MKGLLRSRKFWLSIVGVLQTICLSALGVAPEIWVAIDGLLVTLIAAIAIEDNGERAARR